MNGERKGEGEREREAERETDRERGGRVGREGARKVPHLPSCFYIFFVH